jgi:CHAT domain
MASPRRTPAWTRGCSSRTALTSRRLLGLQFGGALVGLGACDTGLSERLAWDELLGLVRSALQAGAGAVLASLWPVDQLSSSMLLLDFHQRLLGGQEDPTPCAPPGCSSVTHRPPASPPTSPGCGSGWQAIRWRRPPRTWPRPGCGWPLAEQGTLSRRPCVLSLGGGADSDIRRAAELRERARLAGMRPRDPDYARRPFRAAEQCAPFILIGDLV